MNYGRPQFVRDLMVANGDADKPIWISEMAWNAVPDEVADKRFGQVSPEQQARYAVLAYQRALAEWPWAGVINTWYFKRASDDWFREAKPEAYFRLADPDFTLQPVYHSLKAYLPTVQAALHPGTHEPQGWGITTAGAWRATPAPDVPFGQVWAAAEPGARLAFTFAGTELAVLPGCATHPCAGRLQISVDGGQPVVIEVDSARATSTPLVVARGLTDGLHQGVIEALDADAGVIAIRVERRQLPWLHWALAGAAALIVMFLFTRALRRVLRASRYNIPQAAGWH